METGAGFLFSRKSVEWRTPEYLRRALYEEFLLDYDPCPGGTLEGLIVPWPDGCRAFINPPYSHMKEWASKTVFERRVGRCKIAVMLVAARTDTEWFHKYILPNMREIRFIRGRVKFSGAGKYAAPFPSVVVVL